MDEDEVWSYVSHFCFSADEKYIICRHSSRNITIWSVEKKKLAYVSTENLQLRMLRSNAGNIIRSCRPLTNKLWPFPLKQKNSNPFSEKLDVDTIFSYIPTEIRFRKSMYCDDVYVTTMDARNGIFKLEAGPSES